jgi:uncharacterized protein (TIGR03382 family)
LLALSVSFLYRVSTITAGQSSTLTVSASSGATNGAATFTVTGTGSIATHTATATVTVSGGSGTGCPAGEHPGVGGICVPDGCSSTGLGAGVAWMGALAVGALALLRRRRAA